MRCPLCCEVIEQSESDKLVVGFPSNNECSFTVYDDSTKPPTDPGVAVKEQHVVTHLGCRYLHPLISFQDQNGDSTADAKGLLAQSIGGKALAALVRGIASASDIESLRNEGNNHWSANRIIDLSRKAGNIHTMWFPRRLIRNSDWSEDPNLLTIELKAPRQAGKTVFAVLATSRNSYVRRSDLFFFDANFGYAPPRDAMNPMADYKDLLRTMKDVRHGSRQVESTHLDRMGFVGAFFFQALPGSTIDAIMLYDLAGEQHEWDESPKQVKASYHCVVISARDLSALKPLIPVKDEEPAGTSESVDVQRLTAALTVIRKADSEARKSQSSAPKVARPNSLLFGAGWIHENRNPRRPKKIIIAISMMDRVKFPVEDDAGQNTQKLVELRDFIRREMFKSDAAPSGENGPRPAGSEDGSLHRLRQYGYDGKEMLKKLLSRDNNSAEKTLLDLLNERDTVRGVFFTGANNWEAQIDVAPFGIAEAVCWMAMDSSKAAVPADQRTSKQRGKLWEEIRKLFRR